MRATRKGFVFRRIRLKFQFKALFREEWLNYRPKAWFWEVHISTKCFLAVLRAVSDKVTCPLDHFYFTSYEKLNETNQMIAIIYHRLPLYSIIFLTKFYFWYTRTKKTKMTNGLLLNILIFKFFISLSNFSFVSIVSLHADWLIYSK